jgi:hypothetical protein
VITKGRSDASLEATVCIGREGVSVQVKYARKTFVV